jgi:hypothetical protein
MWTGHCQTRNTILVLRVLITHTHLHVFYVITILRSYYDVTYFIGTNMSYQVVKLVLLSKDGRRPPKHVGRKYCILYIYILYMQIFRFVIQLYLSARNDNVKLPGSRFCKRGNKLWDCMQCCNFLPSSAITGFSRCTVHKRVSP